MEYNGTPKEQTPVMTTPDVSGDILENTQQRRKNRKTRFALIAIGLVACVVAAGFIYKSIQDQRARDEALRQAIIQSGVFHDGIVVQGVPVGGMTTQEAMAALLPVEKSMAKTITCSLQGPSHSIPVTAEAFGLVFDTQAVLEVAMQLAREGTLEELQAEIAAIAEQKPQYSITYSANRSAVEAFVAQIAKDVDTPAKDAQFAVLIDKSGVTEEEKKSEAYVLAAASTTPEERLQFVADEDGFFVEQAALVDDLMRMADTKSYKDIAIPFQTIPAQITLENIQENLVLRASSYTSFAKSPYNRATRVFNIQKAAGLVNGTVLLPGEVFSTNDTLGYRTYASGWKPAPAIVQGRSEDQAGGGVCQVSSTLYLCVLRADLEIVYRQGHSGRLSYVEGGLDATIDSGRIDFKWKNNTASPIYVFSWVDIDNKTIHFEIYGEPFPDTFDEITLSSKRIESLSPPGEMQYVVDNSKPVGYSEVYVARKSGSIWESYKTYKKNGETVETITLDRTTYRAYAGQTIVGPTPAQQQPTRPSYPTRRN